MAIAIIYLLIIILFSILRITSVNVSFESVLFVNIFTAVIGFILIFALFY